MKYAEYIKKAQKVYNNSDFLEIGIRFENKERKVGEIVSDCSKSNEDREDPRDFPEYGTDEYEQLEDLDGVSAYDMYNDIGWTDKDADDSAEVTDIFRTKHCYILGVDRNCCHGEDNNEIIMVEPEVLAVLF